MTVSIERLDKVKVELTITVPVEKFEEALKRAYKDMAPKIKVPGFRNGKVPMAVVEKMYGPEVFFEDAANYMIMPNSRLSLVLNLTSFRWKKAKNLSLKQL